MFVFSDSAVFDKVSTAIRNYGGHAQRAIKMSRILSHSVTAWNNYISYLCKGKAKTHVNCFVYFLSACVLMRIAVMSCVCPLNNYMLATEENVRNVRVWACCNHFPIT